MKNVFLFIFSIVLIVSCGRDQVDNVTTDNEIATKRNAPKVIGEIIGGSPVITYDVETLKDRWSNAIKTGTVGTENVLDLTFEAVTITIDEGRYFLRGVDPSNTAKSSMKLKEIGGYLYVDDDTTVTCSGCQPPAGPAGAGQCEPKEVEGVGWYCTECDSIGCKKVVSTKTDSTF